MADEALNTKRLLALRKLTRAVSDLVRAEVRDYLATLAPLLRPQTVFGSLVDAAGLKESVRGADAAFKDLQDVYAGLIGAKPFTLPRELKPPLEVMNSSIELTPVEYGHAVQGPVGSKTVVVTTPLRWVLSYTGYGQERLQEVAAGRESNKEVLEVVVHTLLLHVLLTRQAGIGRMLESLRFPVSAGRLPGLGELPVTFISAPVTTLRPPDAVIVESTEISGTDAFEEVIDLGTVDAIGDPLRQRLLDVVKQHGSDLAPG
jgi:hypothetical protein